MGFGLLLSMGVGLLLSMKILCWLANAIYLYFSVKAKCLYPSLMVTLLYFFARVTLPRRMLRFLTEAMVTSSPIKR